MFMHSWLFNNYVICMLEYLEFDHFLKFSLSCFCLYLCQSILSYYQYTYIILEQNEWKYKDNHKCMKGKQYNKLIN